MFPLPYTGLRLVHDEKVRDAMERARIDAELALNPRRTMQLPLLSNVLMHIRSRKPQSWTQHVPPHLACRERYTRLSSTKEMRR